ncbi:error-prone DNA polymerase [Rubripirellula reticaptiva]|uniref:Error-prone DNA polymerase n=1 Tax=Rubripirellula reticaptiva TaxID=2528013 RepID=A0A5C6FC29_9BACT|nr:error-prone DNA polymerase [Rubripirellula reticaptiva]TWU57179.1 Error-prone DNA polymerase [Rubripirellula reticaptiva]
MQYAELHCKSNFTFLEGASHPDELVERAADLGYHAIALTDRASLAGVVRGWTPAKERGIKYIVGSELHLADAPPMVVWPTDRQAYGRLCRLISRGRLRAEKGECELRFADLAELSDGIIAAVVPSVEQVVAAENGKPTKLARFLRTKFRDTFGDRGYVFCELHRGVDDGLYVQRLQRLAIGCDVPLVAGGDVHYHTPARMLMHDLVAAIRRGTTIDAVASERFANSQRCLRTLDEIKLLYRDVPDAIARTIEIADRCTFTLADLRYEYPAELAPSGMSQMEHLRRLTWEGAKQRWPSGVPDKVLDQLRHEVRLIQELNYEAYFLTVWDMVRFARSRGILCQGRGSAANSAVCYCLGVTSVDPSQTDLLFERFVSRERDEAPDIDVDFEHQRREEVIQYLYEKYGRDRAGMTAVVTTYRTRSAVREVGKSLGVSADAIDAISKLGQSGQEFEQRCESAGLDTTSETGKRFVYLVKMLKGFPRHLSQHTGGMVMTAGNLCELCPVENASMPGRTVIQWNKDDLDELGVLKVDVLALGMLSAIRRCFELVEKHHGDALSLSNIPPDDVATYDMICLADTTGVFQIESRAQMSMLPRLRPRCYYDLVIEVAIVRPGPIQGNMVHPFLQARQDPSMVVYPNDAIRGVLEKTMGVPIFQEQAMRLAVVAAGFTPGEADQLRRAMAAWRRPGVIDTFRIKLLAGMKDSGLTAEFAEHVFNQIRGFGEYGFPESHAASFALLVYASCYLKCHYPAAFCVSLLNSQPMGFYAPAQLIADAIKHGVRVRAVDVNHSDWDSTLEPDRNRPGPSIRLGLRTISGLAELSGRDLVDERVRGGVFRSMDELVRRTKAGKGLLKRLADADAMRSLATDRRAAVWQSLGQENSPGGTPLFDEIDDQDDAPEGLVPMSPQEEVFADYQTTGLSLKAHPISFARNQLQSLGCVCAGDLASLRDGRAVRVAGLVLLRQQPSTAKGIVFVTLEDETGSINLVLFQAVWQRFFRIAKTSNSWLVDGKLENRKGVIHVIVGRLIDLNDEVDFGTDDDGQKMPRSRDFR